MTFDGRPDVMIFTCTCIDDWSLMNGPSLGPRTGQLGTLFSNQWQATKGTITTNGTPWAVSGNGWRTRLAAVAYTRSAGEGSGQ